ncbi:YceI family protein [Pontibacter diazotrophicus]|uniref:YceI family protein n=1 Tax=Pontibacter diazotrophicus TaxID=1400979 RepID=A0A3D8LGR1_9BACT|nr:YceI family protein [Pontibacter diazotrophicus]RDV16516.1 YceI family protein [Pontibacter diazotrophicus]
MRITKYFFAVLATLAFTTTQLAAQSGAGKTLTADTQKSSLVWAGKKIGGEHTGKVSLASGSLQVAQNKLVGGAFDIDMNSITNTDITDADYNAKLVGHLKSDDFFGVEKHPKATFKITKAAPITGAKAGANNYQITGDLTIKGKTETVSFPAAVKISGNTAEAVAKIEVDRSKFDVRYGSPSFFADLGDKAIDNEFIIDLRLVTTPVGATATTKGN